MSFVRCHSVLGQISGFVGAIALALFVSTPAKGGVVTYDVSFSANTFQVGSGSDPAPTDPVTGSFTISLDPTLSYTNDTADITLQTLNIALGSTLSFTYKPVVDGGFSAGTLRVGGLLLGPDTIQYNPSTNDFWLYIQSFTTSPSFQQLGYTQTAVSTNNLFYTLNQTGSATVTEHVAAVPEPSSFAIFAICAGVVGFASARRRNRR